MDQAKSICIPLMIYGTITYMCSIFLSHKFNSTLQDILINYFRWIIGSGSIYYFIPILLFCRVVSKKIDEKILIVVSIISIFLSWDYLPHNEYFTRYLNPFNFIIYYELGRLSYKYNFQPIGKYKVILSIVILFIIYHLWDNPTYFNIYCIIFSTSIFIILYNILYIYNNSILINIGKISFVMYLIHIQIAGVINSLSIKLGFEQIKVFIALFVVSILVILLNKAINQTCNKKWSKYLGFR